MVTNIGNIPAAVARLYIHDVHEHLPRESERIQQRQHWSRLFSPGCTTDFVSAGLDAESVEVETFRSNRATDEQAWTLVQKVWPVCRHTGYGQTVRGVLKSVYQVKEWHLSALQEVTEKMQAMTRPGFYKELLQDSGRILTVQNNALDTVDDCCRPFRDADDYDWIYCDLRVDDLVMPFASPLLERESGIDLKGWDDQLGIINWYFRRCGSQAMAAKCGLAYSRNLDFMSRDESVGRKAFRDAKAMRGNLSALRNAHLHNFEFSRMQNELMHHVLGCCREYNLPVKFHCGHLIGNTEPLKNMSHQLEELVPLIETYPDVRFIIFHLAYPYSRPLITLVKSYPNVYADMSWVWSISPVYAEQFCGEFLTTAPSSKLLAFGGDCLMPELTLAQAAIARRGVARALQTLCKQEWLGPDEAIFTAQRLLRDNAEEIFPKLASSRSKRDLTE